MTPLVLQRAWIYTAGDSLDHSFLVGGLEHDFYVSHHIGNLIIPTDELIFFTPTIFFRRDGNHLSHESYLVISIS